MFDLAGKALLAVAGCYPDANDTWTNLPVIAGDGLNSWEISS